MQLGGSSEIVSHIFQFVLGWKQQGSNVGCGEAPDGMEDNMTYIEN